MSEYRYAIATIQIPLKVFPNEEYEMLMENLNITFTSTDTLPKSNETEIAEEFQAIIKSIFEPPAKIDDTDINKLVVLETDIVPKYRRSKLNTSFKRRYGKSRQYTAKANMASIPLDTVAGRPE